MVGDVRRNQLSENDSSSEPQTRIGADGKERKMPKRQPAPDTDEETPHITQPTLDAQWKAATGNAKAPVELPAHIQELIDELKLCRDNCDCFVECVTSGDCEPDSVKDCAKHLKKLATLMMAYAVEIAP